MFRTDETIVAISTASGSAARAIVRLSGPGAFGLAGGVWLSALGRLADMGGFRAADGRVRLAARGIELPAKAYVFRRPRSYTRQDVVELHVPGAGAAATALAAALIDASARQAEPGECTARAVFAGRIDLSQAEAVADVIDAAGDAQLRSAMAALGGRVFRLCGAAAGQVADALATVEASIDLAGEGITLSEPVELAGFLGDIQAELRSVARQAADMPETADRPHVAIAGRTNVGKSSLLNALSGTDRAIVSALAGTTRDVLSAAAKLPDFPAVVLQDAAGFARLSDELTLAADDAAWQAVARADAVLFVADASAADPADDLALLQKVRDANCRAPMLLLVNKIDLLDASAASRRLRRLESLTQLSAIATSAVRGDGLGELRAALGEQLHLSACRGGEAMGLHERQRRCLLAASDALARAAEVLAGAEEIADVAELAAVELRACLVSLGAVSGQIVTEDILGRIFGRFCVGK